MIKNSKFRKLERSGWQMWFIILSWLAK